MTRIFNSDFLGFFWFILVGFLLFGFLRILDWQTMFLWIMDRMMRMTRIINSHRRLIWKNVLLRMVKVMVGMFVIMDINLLSIR